MTADTPELGPGAEQLAISQAETADGLPVLCATLHTGRFVHHHAQNLSDIVHSSDEGQCRRLLIDLGQAEFIDSTALSVLMRLSGQRKLAVAAANKAVYRVFEVAGLLSLLNVKTTRDAALAAL